MVIVMYRSPVIVVLAHVDHGKTTLLDKIRNTKIAMTERGRITQSIGSTFLPMSIVKDICKKIFEKFDIEPVLQGLLFIDTPGHEAFTAMRERGSNVADIAVLLIDINEGFMPQTIESIEILKKTRTPFVLALNKIDKIFGWKNESKNFIENFEIQDENVKAKFEQRFYEIVNKLEDYGFRADRFDRIRDFSKEIAVVPVSAKTGEGIPELLFVITGLAEKFMNLRITNKCRGIVLEVKHVKGLGTTIDTIVCDGKIEKGDYIVISGEKPIITKIKALLVPRHLQDLRTEKKFEYVDFVTASCGVKIVGPGLEDVVAGSDFRVVKTIEDAEKIKSEMTLKEKLCKKGGEGIILKADTLGGLDALKNIFGNLKIKYGNIGDVTKTDIINAEINEDELLKVIICFNIKPGEDVEKLAKEKKIKIISSDVIYELMDKYKDWKKRKEAEIEKERLKDVTMPGKITVLPGCMFRASKPAIVGCLVTGGVIKPSFGLFKIKGEKIEDLGKIKQIQSEGRNIEQAKSGEKVAVSISDAVFGKNLFENDVLYTNVNQRDYDMLKRFEKILTGDEKKLLEEIGKIKGLI